MKIGKKRLFQALYRVILNFLYEAEYYSEFFQ